jgi:hypothetical protein
MAKQIWEWCIDKNIWLTVAHIPGKQNLVADYESRRHQRESEWMLNKALLSDTLVKLNFSPEIDLFATRVNKQFPKYVAYRPELPNWPTQSWYAKAFHMMTQEPVYIKASKSLLSLPSHPQEVHPIWQKMNLIICLLSGRN